MIVQFHLRLRIAKSVQTQKFSLSERTSVAVHDGDDGLLHLGDVRVGSVLLLKEVGALVPGCWIVELLNERCQFERNQSQFGTERYSTYYERLHRHRKPFQLP